MMPSNNRKGPSWIHPLLRAPRKGPLILGSATRNPKPYLPFNIPTRNGSRLQAPFAPHFVRFFVQSAEFCNGDGESNGAPEGSMEAQHGSPFQCEGCVVLFQSLG